MENEIWMPLPEWGNRYEVSSFGKVRSLVSGITMRQHVSTRGYYKIGLSVIVDGKHIKKNVAVHRLVCSAFYENPENKPQVNHKDLDQLNNHYLNLEWATAKENTNHAQANGRMPIKKVREKKGRKTKQVIDIETGEIFITVDELCKEKNLNSKNIRRQVSGERYCHVPYRYLGMEDRVKFKPEKIKPPKKIKEIKPKKVYIPHPLPRKKMVMYSVDGIELRTFKSSSDAATFVKSNRETFIRAIKRSPNNFTKGYVFKYKE